MKRPFFPLCILAGTRPVEPVVSHYSSPELMSRHVALLLPRHPEHSACKCQAYSATVRTLYWHVHTKAHACTHYHKLPHTTMRGSAARFARVAEEPNSFPWQRALSYKIPTSTANTPAHPWPSPTGASTLWL